MAPRQKPGRSRQCYRTPPEFLQAVERAFAVRRWDWDLAATQHNRICAHYFGRGSPDGRDSLVEDWTDLCGNLWCNSTFSNLHLWTAKGAGYAENHVKQGRLFMLLPASVGSEWYHQHVEGIAHVVNLRPRLTFVGCLDPYPKDLVLAVYGEVLGGVSSWAWKRP
jgi:phage N-6-adenine-methyltransferase